jgi:hypothetical protein
MSLLRDPLGRQIELADWTWWGHIVKGHPEVRNHRSEVEAAIQSPKGVYFSASDPDCRLYYGDSSRRPLMICVVADVTAGRVKTAYFAKRIKPGAMEWP